MKEFFAVYSYTCVENPVENVENSALITAFKILTYSLMQKIRRIMSSNVNLLYRNYFVHKMR